jgi:hypothetical protein
MKKRLATLAACATLSAAPMAAHAHGDVGAAVLGGVVIGAVIGSSIAHPYPYYAYGPPPPVVVVRRPYYVPYYPARVRYYYGYGHRGWHHHGWHRGHRGHWRH